MSNVDLGEACSNKKGEVMGGDRVNRERIGVHRSRIGKEIWCWVRSTVSSPISGCGRILGKFAVSWAELPRDQRPGHRRGEWETPSQGADKVPSRELAGLLGILSSWYPMTKIRELQELSDQCEQGDTEGSVVRTEKD
jgi:hypothetical protein